MPIEVNGFVIGDDEVRKEALRLAGQYPWKMAPASQDKTLDLFNTAEQNIVSQVLLAQYASTYPPFVDPELVDREVAGHLEANKNGDARGEDQLRSEVVEQLKMQAVIRELAGYPGKATDEDASRFFERNRADFNAEGLLAGAHILVSDRAGEVPARERIEAALHSLEAGMSFAEAAQKFSDCPGDGDLGVFQRGMMVPEFESVLAALHEGERSGIFRTPFGFQIAERHAVDVHASILRDAAPTIRQFLDHERNRQAYEAAAELLRSRSTIRYLDADEGEAP